jgi:hypothetical protein
MRSRGQGLTLTENVGRGLLLRPALPAQWAACQPHQMEMTTQGVMRYLQSSNHPGLCPIKGQKPNPGTPTRPPKLIREPVVGCYQGSAIFMIVWYEISNEKGT